MAELEHRATQGMAKSDRAAEPGHAPFFYGWVIAAISGLGIAAGISVYLPSTIGLLIGPLGREFGWTPPEVIAALTFNTVATLVAAPLTGRLVDRVGPRKVLLGAFIGQALLMMSFTFMGGGLASLYARYVLFAVFATGTTAITYSALISRWFDRRRGLALGIVLGGVGLGGAIWSILSQYLFDLVGWRDALLYLGLGVLFVILPIQYLVVRDRPQDLNLLPDGAQQAAEVDAASPKLGYTVHQAIATPRFWLVLVTFFLCTCAAYGVMLNLVTILIAQGAEAQTAANVQASIWIAILFGRVFTGWLLDHFFAPRIAFAFLLPGIVGALLLANGASGGAALAAAMLVGLAAGAEIDVLAYVVGRYFGLAHFGAIYSINFSAAALATSVGPLAAALIAAQYGGDYTIALMSLAGVFATAGLLLLLMPRFPKEFESRP